MAAVVALAGFMGAGKTVVGEQLASSLGWRFVDLDSEFEKRHPEGIARFFADKGELAFRVEELSLLEEILAGATQNGSEEGAPAGLVLALGGGTVETPQAVELLGKHAITFHLKVTPGTAWSRVQGTDRPLAKDHAVFSERFSRRRDLYEQAADWIVPVENRSPSQVVEDILWVLRTVGTCFPRTWGRLLASTQRRSTVIGGAGSLLRAERLLAPLFAAGQRVFVITDENVFFAWGSHVLSLLDAHCPTATLVIPPGEQSKSIQTLARCWEWLASCRAHRDDLVVALGGGVIGDLAGFAAATYQRGMSLWQTPTTLLAQVDSSVGGKTAVNLPAGKNLVGTFYQPDMVIIDPLVLDTLPEHTYQSGLAEVVKYALLSSSSFFSFLENNTSAILARDPDILALLIKRCVLCKAEVVEQDETENGFRAVLNLGHTVAHALEKVLGYGTISHGEAVSLGLMVALRLSEELLGLDKEVRARTACLLEQFGLPTSWELADLDIILAATVSDKKARAGSTNYVGLEQIGKPVTGLNPSLTLLREALEVIVR